MKIEANELVHVEPAKDFSSAILHFVLPDKSSHEVQLSFDSLAKVAPEILRLCVAFEQQKTSAEATAKGYRQVAFSPVQNLDVGVDATRSRVLLMMDRDTPRQIGYVLPPAGARRMGEGLLARAAECETPQRKM